MSTSRASLSSYCAMLVLCCLLARAGCALAEEPRADSRGSGGRPAPDRAPPIGVARENLASDLQVDRAITSKLEPRFDSQFERTPLPLGGATTWGAEFRPHGQGLSSHPSQAADLFAAPTLRLTNAWQRLEDYKARRGIRLLTLWESKFSTLSVQTGRSGNPSLQWTSRSFSSGDASEGLFDRLLSKGIDEFETLGHHERTDGVTSETPASQK